MQNKQTFYQLDSKNKVRQWSTWIEVDPNGLVKLFTESGLKDGKKILSETPILNGMNIGRSNETTPYQQALQDMQTEIDKKKRKGMVQDIALIKAKSDTATIKDPMKGHSYHPTNAELGKNLKKLKLEGKEVGIQRKLDGWRYRIYVNRDEIIYYTSSGKVTLEFPHISASIRKTFDANIDYWFNKYGTEEYYLDGEIYNHDLGFQLSASACATGGNKIEQSELDTEQKSLRDQMHFYIFDVCIDAPYNTREKIVKYFYDSNLIKEVHTYREICTDEIIDKYFQQFLSEGYEGVIIRTLDENYQYKKCGQLTKYKPVIDDEFQIVGFEESIKKETLGALYIQLNDGRIQRTNLKSELGTDKKRKEIWDNQDIYLGKWVTVEFLEYTDDKKLRLPRAKSERAGKSKD